MVTLVVGGWLDQMILEVFSNLNDSTILFYFIIQELDLMILRGPFQLGIFYDSMILFLLNTCDIQK